MEPIVEQELAIRAAIPTAAPGGTIPAPGTILIKDSNTTQPTYVPGVMIGNNIIISHTKPAALADQAVPWLYKDENDVIDYTKILLVFPDVIDHNKCIILNDITFTP